MRNTRRSSLSPPPSPCSFTAVAALSTSLRSSSQAGTVGRPARSRSARKDRRNTSQTPGHSAHPTDIRREHPTDIRRAVPARPTRRFPGQDPARPQIRIQCRLPRLDVIRASRSACSANCRASFSAQFRNSFQSSCNDYSIPIISKIIGI